MTMFDFGDNVRVRSAPETVKLGLAGFSGQVYGVTTPSITGVKVIGDIAQDCAINVNIPSIGNDLWFSPDLLEFIDHAPGTVITVGSKRLVRKADGSWE